MSFPAFQLTCPRCQSLNFEVIGLKQGPVFRAAPGAVFTCNDCEKQLFGDMVQSVYDRQLAQHIALYREWKKGQAGDDAGAGAGVGVGAGAGVGVGAGASASAQCAWMECSNLARENSKYCSRSCSNKNARHRERLRKAG